MKESKLKLIAIGQFLVNVPVTIIILLIRYIAIQYYDLRSIDASIIGLVAGWIYWYFAIRIWIKRALANNYQRDEILRIGRSNLLLWNKSTIDKVK